MASLERRRETRRRAHPAVGEHGTGRVPDGKDEDLR